MSNAANTVTLNGQGFKLLPLNWRQLTECRDHIIVINKLNPANGMFTEVEQTAILEVVTASLQRSTPSVTKEFVLDNLDLGNVGDILKMVFGISTQNSADPVPGEAKAVTSPS